MAELPTLARSHHVPDRRSFSATARPRDKAERGARARRRRAKSLVRGPLRAGGERGGDPAVPEDGVRFVHPAPFPQ